MILSYTKRSQIGSTSKRYELKGTKNFNQLEIGGRSGILVEPLVVVRRYQVQWIRPKPDLVKLAKLRGSGWSLREIGVAMKVSKTTLIGWLKKLNG